MTSVGTAATQETLAKTFGVVTFPSAVHRLSDVTRLLAVRALSGELGRAMVPAGLRLASAEDGLQDPELRAAEAVALIAREAPLRILEGELLVGASTLLEAARHEMPMAGIPGTSHTTIGFERALDEGMAGVRRRIADRLRRGGLTAEQRRFLDAGRICAEALGVWHARHVVELQRRISVSQGAVRDAWLEVLHSLRRVPEHPPRTFREAVQSLWFLWEFQRLCGNWSGLGRVDKMLGGYLRRDLDAGSMTTDGARELLAHFWVKGCEWTGAPTGSVGSSGDAQFYQNVVLGGVDSHGRSVVNEVTYLVLDIVEELHVSDFPIAVRVGAVTPERLWRRIADVQRLGGGIVSIYNEDVVIPALVRFGYPLGEAREFANDGCWEVLVPGKTAFSYRPFDMLCPFQEAIGLSPDEADVPECRTFEELYERFLRKLRVHLARIWDEAAASFVAGPPSPLLSLFVDDCIEKAKGYHHRGARYSVRSPHAGGLPDTANALFALKTVVYDEKCLSLGEFAAILRSNWDGHESLRRDLRRRLVLYGNDSEASDAMLRRVYDDYVSLCAATPSRNGVLMPCGISTFGREIAFKAHRGALPFGSLAGDTLASNLSPTPGTDRNGPTAVVNSFCKQDFEQLPCGTPLDIKLHPTCLAGGDGVAALVALLKRFVSGGGMYLQVDAVDSDVLRDAQCRPELYPNLAVRVSGWSARFTTLGREWQDMIIQRTEQHLTG